MHRKCSCLIFLLIIVIAATLRMATIQRLSVDGQPVLLGYDPYYHLRRADLLLNGTSIPETDHFSAYPQGANAHWSPVFDVMGWGFLRAGSALGLEKETAISFLPVMLGIFAVLALLPFFTRSDPPFAAPAAILLAAFFPAHIRPASYGFADHHVLELVLMTLTLTLLSRADRLHTAVVTGLLLGISQASWRGALIVTFVTGASLICLSCLPLSGISSRTWSRSGIVIMGIASLAYMASSAMGIVDLFALDFFTFSLFQAIPFWVLMSFFLIRYLWLLHHRKTSIALILLFVLGSAIAVHSTWTVWVDGFSFLLGRHPWRETISESYSLFRGVVFPPWNAVEELFGGLFYLLPVLLGYQLWLFLRRKDSPRHMIALIWCVMMLILTLKQQRYAHQMSVPFILILILSVIDAKPLIRKLGGPIRFFVVLFAVFSFIPVVTFHYHLLRYGHNTWFRIPDAHYRAYKWMQTTTPDSGLFLQPDRVPSYGIMNAWDNGHWITWIARRAPVANNFGAEPGGHREGLETSCRFFVTADNDEALSLMDRSHARYVVTEYFGDKLSGFAYIAGMLDDGQRSLSGIPVSTRLYLLNGADGNGPDGRNVPGVNGFRLIYESDALSVVSGNQLVPAVKIFERVKGARIQIPEGAMPPYRLSLTLLTESNKKIPFIRTWNQPMNELPLYYSFSDCPYACRGIDSAKLDWPGGSALFTAGEDAVVSGGNAECIGTVD